MKKILSFIGLFIMFFGLLFFLSNSIGKNHINYDSSFDNKLNPGQGFTKTKLNRFLWFPAPLYTFKQDYNESVFPYPPGSDLLTTKAIIIQYSYWALLAGILSYIITLLILKNKINKEQTNIYDTTAR